MGALLHMGYFVRLLTLSVFCGGVVFQSAFGDPLTLKSAIDEAKQKQPLYQSAKEALKETSWKPLEALSQNLPNLSITANHLFDVKYQFLNVSLGGFSGQFPFIFPKTIFSLAANWTIFDGLKGWAAYQGAKFQNRAAELELSRETFKLEQDIRLRYYRALASKLLLDVAEKNLRTLEDHLAKTQDLLSEGSATRFDLLRVKVQLEEAVPEKLTAEDNVTVNRDALREAMGLEADNRSLTGALPIPPESGLPKDLTLQVQQREDLEALNRRADAADRAADSAAGFWFPRVTLTAEKDFYNNTDFGVTNAYNDAYSLGIILTWDLFDGGASIARQQQAIHQHAQAELAARAALLKAPQEIDLWRRRYLTNSSLYHAKVRAIEAGEESVRLARLGFDAGTRTSTDVLDAELDLFRARAGLVQAQLNAAEAIVNLELALGRKLS